MTPGNITFPLGRLTERVLSTVASWFTLARWGIESDELDPAAPGDALYLATRQAFKKAQELELAAAMAWRRAHELQASLATREAVRACLGAPAAPSNVYTLRPGASAWAPESAVQRLRGRAR